MELRTGYKQTEIGVIPEDWEVKSLGEIGKFSKGQGIRKDDAQSGDIPCVRYGELYTRHNDYVKQFYSFISRDISLTSRKLKYGDILFAGSGETKEDIGKNVAFVNDFEAYAGGDIVILSPINQSPLYLGFLLNAPFIQKQKASKGQGDAVVHISASQLQYISIPIPTIAEQTAIATALSDADGLITALEKLIAKKRDIKQGAMQELLKPKEGWEVKKLGEVCDVIIGLTYSPNDVRDHGTLVLRSSNIQNNKLAFENNVFVEMDLPQRVIVKENDILVCVRNGSKQLIGKCALIDKKNEGQAFGAFMSIIRSQYNKYIYHYFLSNYIQIQIDENMGATINQLTNATLKSFDIYFPQSPEEQTRIATILSDMDAELTALEAKLEKYKKIKLGMMQELLTGRIRLI
ncbi:restriction endonuclease subunit S [Flavobacterium xanthum]|uniref:Type I restriction enzyme, S subunit n=1 Tax=Flavobacterium xanthum TaxID=69322 RepID=A0A1M7JNW1_9FLAO|nr:restriction endonuclease subunit S [Flavobacterium xanthum]SHM54698.1 type I restriction enzyme, S subunit [Flavobacterium xanthum]